MKTHSRCRLWVFAKAPVPGQVKTRLQPDLDQAAAAALHRELVIRTLQRLSLDPPCPVGLACAPDTRHPFFTEMAERFELPLLAQAGADLGERMAGVVSHTLAQGEWPILVGTDCPAMNSETVAMACRALDAGNDAVIGPAEDGGYALLGLRGAVPGLFTALPWGTGQVLACTRDVLRQSGKRWTELPTLWDVDRPLDLARYEAMLAEEAAASARGVRNSESS